MKSCPFCAEEIQDEAIVCKHCQRDLTARPVAVPPAVAPPKASLRWGRILLVVGVLLGAFFWTLSLRSEDPRLTAFKSRRAAWHQQCDAYVAVPDNKLDAAGLVCLREFQAMMTYAKQQGW